MLERPVYFGLASEPAAGHDQTFTAIFFKVWLRHGCDIESSCDVLAATMFASNNGFSIVGVRVRFFQFRGLGINAIDQFAADPEDV